MEKIIKNQEKSKTHIEVTSVTEYMDAIERFIRSHSKKDLLFYRGQDDKNVDITPKVYRNFDRKSHISEHNAYKEILSRSHNSFLEDKTVIERLIRMQHYGIPTRLLDLTELPLVALYFACNEGSVVEEDEHQKLKKDGVVYLFQKNENEVHYSDEIPKSALLGLQEKIPTGEYIRRIKGPIITSLFSIMISNISNEEIKKEIKAIKYNEAFYMDQAITEDEPQSIVFCEKIIEQGLKCFENNQKLKQYIKSEEGRLVLADIENQYYSNMLERSYLIPIASRGNDKNKWKDQFIDGIRELQKIYFFKVPLNNDRIVRQKSAFMLFAPLQPLQKKSVPYDLKIIIKNEAKGDIKKELIRYGITESFLYPEIYRQTKDIYNRVYKPQEYRLPVEGDNNSEGAIENVQQYMEKIKNFIAEVKEAEEKFGKKNAKKKVLFYRGQSAKEYKLVAGANRNFTKEKSHLNEHRAYNELLSQLPSSFANDRTIMEKLIRMQHYELPTRLLDITQLPLVALYFASKDEYINRRKGSEDQKERINADGAVYLFFKDEQDICYSDEVPDYVLHGLQEKQSVEDYIRKIKEPILEAMNNLIQYRTGIEEFDQELEKLYKNKDKFNELIPEKDPKALFTNLEEIKETLKQFENFEKLETEIKIYEKVKTKERQKEIKVALLNLRRQYYSFIMQNSQLITIVPRNLIKGDWIEQFIDGIKNLKKYYFIKVPLNNDRIIRQQGSFILCSPLQPIAEEEPKYDLKIIIKADKKEEIREELARYGNTESYLFPELEKQSDEIRKEIYGEEKTRC